MVDERINAQLTKDVEELKSKIQFNLENTETKHEEIRFEVKSFQAMIDSTVKKDVFKKEMDKIVDIKKSVFSEIDSMHKHLRDQIESIGEMKKRMENIENRS